MYDNDIYFECFAFAYKCILCVCVCVIQYNFIMCYADCVSARRHIGSNKVYVCAHKCTEN